MISEVDAFKNELRNYLSYKEQLAKRYEDLRDLLYIESGVSGIDPAKEHFSYNESMINNVRYSLMDKIADCENEISRLQHNIGYVRRVMLRIPLDTRKKIFRIYGLGKTYRQVEIESYTSKGALYKQVTNALTKALKENTFTIFQ